MNHVAHCLLSYPDPDILIGNFIGDDIKGKAWKEFPVPIQRGILLHREIDGFTDTHPMTRTNVDRVREFAGRYSAPVVDILCDHLLCLNWSVHVPGVSFDEFAEWAYRSLDEHQEYMPENLRRIWPHMRRGRFLHNYTHRNGMEWVMSQFKKRLVRPVDTNALLSYFFEHTEVFSTDFNLFFPDLAEHCRVFRASTL